MHALSFCNEPLGSRTADAEPVAPPHVVRVLPGSRAVPWARFRAQSLCRGIPAQPFRRPPWSDLTKRCSECRVAPHSCLTCFRDALSCRGRFGRWLGRINPSIVYDAVSPTAPLQKSVGLSGRCYRCGAFGQRGLPSAGRG